MNTSSVSQVLMQAECYKVLAMFYNKPKDGVHNNPILFKILVKSSGLLGPKAFEVSKKLRSTGLNLSIKDEIIEHSRLFALAELALAYPCSSQYIKKTDHGNDLTTWLTNLYRNAGYQPYISTAPIDHISTELGFISHLLAGAAKGFKEDDMSAINYFGELRCLFVREHLIKWAPDFTRCILNNSQSPFYLQLAILTRAIIVHCAEDEEYIRKI